MTGTAPPPGGGDGYDLVVRAHRVVTSAGQAACCVGVRGGVVAAAATGTAPGPLSRPGAPRFGHEEITIGAVGNPRGPAARRSRDRPERRAPCRGER